MVEFSQGMIDSATPGLSGRIDAVVETIRSYCEWHIFPVVTHDFRLDGPNSNLLQLPTMHARKIELLAELGREILPENYDWSSRGQIAKHPHHCHFTGRLGSIRAVVEHGYPQCPSDLYGVIVAMVLRGAAAPVPGRTGYTVGQRSETFANQAGNFGDVVPFAEEYRTLSTYKLPALSGFH